MSCLSNDAAVRRIHDSAWKLVLVATGGGSRAIAELLQVPGASQTVLEALVPYSAAALEDFLGSVPEQHCSEETARTMAMAAFQRAQRLAPDDPATLAGVGCTASLASNRPKRGDHRMHIAVQTARSTRVTSLTLDKHARTRAEEEALSGNLILQAILHLIDESSGTEPVEIALALRPDELPKDDCLTAPTPWSDLLLGRTDVVPVGTTGDELAGSILFPGAFHPLHEGHRQMAQAASELEGCPVVYELSITNVDKPALDFLELRNRLDQFGCAAIVLTRAATFVEKAILFPGTTFLVGADTIQRVADPKYYGGDPACATAAIRQIAELGGQFLVCGRLLDGQYRRLSDLELPAELLDICREIPPEVFRLDVSSTEIRKTAE